MDAAVRQILADPSFEISIPEATEAKSVPQDCWSGAKIRPMKRTSMSFQQRYASKWIPYSQAAGPSIHPTGRRCGETISTSDCLWPSVSSGKVS